MNAMIFPVSETLLISYTNSFATVNPSNDNAIIRMVLFCFFIPIIKKIKDRNPHKIGKLDFQILVLVLEIKSEAIRLRKYSVSSL